MCIFAFNRNKLITEKMKKLKMFAVLMTAVMMLSSCSILGGLGGSTATATGVSANVDGQASGAALKNLYTAYKADGKVDMSNISNILNVVTLAKNIQGLKGQEDTSDFYRDFGIGLVAGSNNLVTNKTSSPVTNTLGALASSTDLSALTSLATTAATQAVLNSTSTANTAASAASALSSVTESTAGVANTLSSLSSIFSLLK